MNDAVLGPADRKEALSRAYVAAVAAGAGYTLAVQDFDRDGIDVQVRASGTMRPSLDVQLKATSRLTRSGDGEFRYPLPRHNYDLLREQSLVPRILVVLDLPRDESEWLSISVGELVIRRCAYWKDLLGEPETANKQTITIAIESKNLFDVENLRNLMKRARRDGPS